MLARQKGDWPGKKGKIVAYRNEEDGISISDGFCRYKLTESDFEKTFERVEKRSD